GLQPDRERIRQVQTLLRKTAARSDDTLQTAIAERLQRLHPSGMRQLLQRSWLWFSLIGICSKTMIPKRGYRFSEKIMQIISLNSRSRSFTQLRDSASDGLARSPARQQ